MANNELFDAGIKVTGPFSATGSFPVDGKYIVETIAERDDHVTQNRAYDGMQVYVKENKKTYQYVIKDEVGQWKDFCDETVYRHAVENKGIAVGITMGDSTVPGLYKIKTNDEGHVVEVSPITKTDIIDLGITISGIEYGVGGDNLGLVKNGGNVTINPDGTMTAPTSGGTVDGDGGTVDGDGNAWYKGDVYVGGTSPDDGKRLATENYVNEQKPIFIATYGKTTYEELLNAFKSNKQLILHIPAGKASAEQPEMYASLVRLDGGGDNRNFAFVCLENNVEHHFVMEKGSGKWTNYNITLADNNVLSSKISGLQNSVGSIRNILKSVYSFRGEPRNSAGILHIKNPGIYLIMQGGAGNKQIIINQNGTEALNETWNGIIILAYESGDITPIGIVSSLTIAGAFKTPGTFRGWTSDGRYSTTIKYPAKCVVSYLGNSNVDYLS